MRRKIYQLVLAAILAAMYIVLTLPFAQITFSMIQFRLAEALTVLPVFSAAAIPGLFVGCLISNFLNPMNLGLIDIFGGSLTTLLAAMFTWLIGKPFRDYFWQEPEATNFKQLSPKYKSNVFLALLPPVLLNGIIIGSYLPFLLLPERPTATTILMSIASISISQSIVIYAIGMPLLFLLLKNHAVHQYLR